MTAKQSPENPQTNTEAGKSSDKRSLKKILKISGIAVIAVFVLLVIIGAMTSVVPKYSVSDLVMVKNNNIQFSRPVQWQDASYADNLVKDFGLEVSNASIYGDKVIKDKDGKYDIANAAVIFGQSGSDSTDVAVLKTSEFRTKFEELMNQQLQQNSFKSEACQSISNYGMNFNYDYNNFPVSVAIKLNCKLSDAEREKFDAESIEMRIAFVIANDGKSYVYALVASDKSWAKNEQVYFQMLRDFKAL